MSLQKRSFNFYIGLVCTASFGDNILISYQDNPHAEIPKGKNSKFFKLCQTLKMPYRLRKQDTNDKGKRRRSDRLIPVSSELCTQNRPHSRWWQTSADSTVRIYCPVSVGQNQEISVGRIFECPDLEFELDFDRQTPHSKSGQNLDNAARRRLDGG